MQTNYDHIVIGSGGIGSATAYWLSQFTKSDVLVIEQYELGHPWGASEDHSRIIRHIYDSLVYTALTPAMYETWRHVERQSGLSLLTLCGCLNLAVEGTEGAADLATHVEVMRAADLPHQELTQADITNRWPEWNLPRGTVGIYHGEAGILDIRRANSAHRALARVRGVTFLAKTPVVAVEPDETGITVHTAEQTYRAGKVILCAGSWSETLLATAGVKLPLTLSQEQVTYFLPREPQRFAPDRWPIWIWHTEEDFYGFPVYGEAAVKAARDMTGRFVTQETRQWRPIPEETALVTDFLRERLPAAVGPEYYSRTCVYDMPPDRDFVLDHAPGEPRLMVAIGAGHAAKFASLIGKIMAELATAGKTSYPIDAFRFDRPALTDPDFVPTF